MTRNSLAPSVRVALRWSALVLVAALAIRPAAAQKVGTTSFQFLKVMPSARATGMGEAFTAVARGSDALFWNPAGLTSVEKMQVSATQVLWLFDTGQSAVAFGANAGRWGHVGVQFQYVDYGAIEETRVEDLGFGQGGTYNPGLTGATFSPRAYVVGLSYGRSLTDRFSAGLTAKYASESLYSSGSVSVGENSYNTSASAVLFDFGMQYDTDFRSTRIGASVQNFGPSVQFAEEEFPAPMTFRLGIAADLMGRNGLIVPNNMSRLTLSYDLVQPNDYDQQMHLGAEYGFMDVLALRGGYKLNYDADNWTFGGGLHTGVAGVGLAIDYSYGGMNAALGSVHRFSISAGI